MTENDISIASGARENKQQTPSENKAQANTKKSASTAKPRTAGPAARQQRARRAPRGAFNPARLAQRYQTSRKQPL